MNKWNTQTVTWKLYERFFFSNCSISAGMLLQIKTAAQTKVVSLMECWACLLPAACVRVIVCQRVCFPGELLIEARSLSQCICFEISTKRGFWPRHVIIKCKGKWVSSFVLTNSVRPETMQCVSQFLIFLINLASFYFRVVLFHNFLNVGFGQVLCSRKQWRLSLPSDTPPT